jgi:hypothetical protein
VKNPIKLPSEQAGEIKALLAEEVKRREIAGRYGVSLQLISDIATGRRLGGVRSLGRESRVSSRIRLVRDGRSENGRVIG